MLTAPRASLSSLRRQDPATPDDELARMALEHDLPREVVHEASEEVGSTDVDAVLERVFAKARAPRGFGQRFDPKRARELAAAIQADVAPAAPAAPAGEGEERVVELPPTPAEQADAAVEAAEAAEHAKAGKAGKASKEGPTPGRDEDLAARVEAARAEMGQVKERSYGRVPALLDPKWAAAFEATLAKLGEPLWFAADPHSLERLRAIAASSGKDYDREVAVHGFFRWCGAFVANHLGLAAKVDGHEVGWSLVGDALAKSMFTYTGSWAGARIEDPDAPAEALLPERYKPLEAYHAAHGGAREWHPVATWKGDPTSVVKPGMVLFNWSEPIHGNHITLVDRVEPDGEGGWRIHTLEGNAEGAKTKAGVHTIDARGKTEITAVARPAALDFDARARILKAPAFARQCAQQAAALRQATATGRAAR